MSKELAPIDVSRTPELLSLARQVKETGERLVLKDNGEELAVIAPLPRSPLPPKGVRRKTGIVTKDDSLWNIVGIARTHGPTDVSANKQKYLADAYVARR